MPYLLSLSTTSPSHPTSYRKLRERNHEIMTLGSSDPSSDSDSHSDSNLAHNVASSRDSHSVSQQLPTTTTLAARERALVLLVSAIGPRGARSSGKRCAVVVS
jgi:hypothetical protein